MLNNSVLVLADPNSIHTKKWIEGWNMLGYESTVTGLSKKNFDNKLIFEADINVSGGNAKAYLKNTFKFRTILKQYNPKIINAHYMTSYGLIASLIKRRNDKIVLFLMGTDVMVNLDKNFLFVLLGRFILWRSDILVSSSETMTKRLLEDFPKMKPKILTQQYGVDTAMLDKYRQPQKSIDILTNRGWVKNSNYEVILEAFSQFECNKALVGFPETNYSQELIQNYPHAKEQIYKQIAYTKNMQMVGQSKIFISLTSSDGLSLSLLEAMYLGAIPIVSDIEANREVIEDGINGFLIDINVKDLVSSIKKVLKLDEIDKETMRLYNQKIVLKKFDFNTNFNILNDKLKEE